MAVTVPETQPAEQSSQASVPLKPIKAPTKLPIILMTVITLISLVISGYFGYQNYQLRKQISQVQATPSPTATTPSPTSIPDLTADWETYTSAGDGFIFKYPNSWYVTKIAAATYIGPSKATEQSIQDSPVSKYVVVSPSMPEAFLSQEELEDLEEKGYLIERKNLTIDGQEIIRYHIQDVSRVGVIEYEEIVYIEIPRSYGVWDVRTSNKNLFENFDQILSTFKFLE